MRWRKTDKPLPLPVQALDQATGYLMAAVAVRGASQRLEQGNGMKAHLSLARTANLLVQAGAGDVNAVLSPETSADLSPTIENTDWGPAMRLNPPSTIETAPMHWCRPACRLGSAEPRWL